MKVGATAYLHAHGHIMSCPKGSEKTTRVFDSSEPISSLIEWCDNNSVPLNEVELSKLEIEIIKKASTYFGYKIGQGVCRISDGKRGVFVGVINMAGSVLVAFEGETDITRIQANDLTDSGLL